MKTWQNMDKSDWSDGPWKTEPDKAHWIDPATGLDCLIVRHPQFGHLCGYVGVPETYSTFGKDYDDIHAGVDVHDGVTLSKPCPPEDRDDESRHICHPKDGAANEIVWWFGFAGGGAFDLMPNFPTSTPGYAAIQEGQTYRDFDFMKSETTELARQLVIIEAREGKR